MAVESRLASALGRKDEEPNIALADEIVGLGDEDAVVSLIAILARGKRAAQADAIKVLYEIGDREPSLISEHIAAFINQLESKNNRLVWGALTALSAIAKTEAERVWGHMDDVLRAADNGSVIAKDQAMNILVAQVGTRHSVPAMAILLERLRTSAVNQLPMYAERIEPALSVEQQPAFRQVLEDRLGVDMPASKRKRIERVIKRLGL